MEEYRIDPELNNVLPALSNEDYKALEQSLLTDGYKGAPIMVWDNVIVDGHNRYEICKKYNIPYEIKKVEFESKEDAIHWMVRQQLGRRNLSPMQRIAVAEKSRPFYEKKARENLKLASGGDRRSKEFKKYQGLQNSSKVENKIDVRAELSRDANTSTDTYSKGLKILQAGDKELIDQTMSGKKSIHKAYRELKEKQQQKVPVQDKSRNNSDINGELKNLKEIQRKKAAQKIKMTREKYGIDSPEYEDAKAEQLRVEQQISAMENSIHNPQNFGATESTLIQIQKCYQDYFMVFQKDIEWLLSMEYLRDDEDISGKIHSDLKNCLGKLKCIGDMIRAMVVDEFGSIVIEK